MRSRNIVFAQVIWFYAEGGDWDKLGRSAIWRGEIPELYPPESYFPARLYVSDMPTEWADVLHKF